MGKLLLDPALPLLKAVAGAVTIVAVEAEIDPAVCPLAHLLEEQIRSISWQEATLRREIPVITRRYAGAP